MVYQAIHRSSWNTFGDRISSELKGREVELEVIGLDLGDQMGARLTLDDVSYDSPGNALHLVMHAASGHGQVDHIIHSPQEIYIELSDTGVSQLAIIDGEGHKQLLWVHQPPQLRAD